MAKRLICLLLVAVLLFSTVPPVYAAEEDWELCQVQVLFGGIPDSMPVLKNRDGQLLAKVDSIRYYSVNMVSGIMDGVLAYCPADQEAENYGRYTFVDPNTGDFVVGLHLDDAHIASYVAQTTDYGNSAAKKKLLKSKGAEREKLLDAYFAQRNTQVQRVRDQYLVLFRGSFSVVVHRDGEMWVPLDALLPLLYANVSVSKDHRYLCMDPIQESLYDVLREEGEQAQALLFDSEDVVGNDVMAGGGWLVSTFTGEIQNFIPNLGRQMDYEDLFEDYLTDNEVYLSTFDAEENATTQYILDVSKSYKGAKTVVSKGIEVVKGLYQFVIRSEPDPDYYMRFFDIGKNAREFGGTALDVTASLMEYVNVYANQVDDHRKMLMAVYDFEAQTGWPSYKAAKTVSDLYDTAVNNSGVMADVVIRDVVFEQLGELIYQKLYGPWYDIIEVGKVVFQEEYDYIVDSGSINLVSNTVQYSYSVFLQRLYRGTNDMESLEKTRLCLMMALIGSRHAYKTYWGESRSDDVEAIDRILTKLYTAGRWDEITGARSYEDAYEALRKDVKELSVRKNDPVTIAENGMVVRTLENDYWYASDRYEAPLWYLYDTTGDGLDELYIHQMVPHSADYVRIQVDPKAKTVTETVSYNDHELLALPCVHGESAAVFGETQTLLAQLDSHFAGRDGFLGSVDADINADGENDRIYAVYRAAQMYDSLYQGTLTLYDGSISLVAAVAQADGIELQFFCDNDWDAYAVEQSDPDQWKTRLSFPMTWFEGTLTVAGASYQYDPEKGTFTPTSNATPVPGPEQGPEMGSVLDYLSGARDLLTEPNAQVSYMDPYEYENVLYAHEVYLSDIRIIQHVGALATSNEIISFQISHYGQEMPIEGDLTTCSTPRELIEGLSTVVSMWDSSVLYGQDRYDGIVGPYPVYNVGRDIYETSLCWQLPNGNIYMVVIQTETDSLDDPILYIRFDLLQ